MTAVLAVGWAIALACGGALAAIRRRLAWVADAEHELRGALTAFGLAVERLSRMEGRQGYASTLECELQRAGAALEDLASARCGRRAAEPPVPLALERLARSAARAWGPRSGSIELDWRAGRPLVVAPAGRVAQALGNVVSNAVEHGHGPVRLVATRGPESVLLEVSNGRGPAPAASPRQRGRGRGLRIAGRAARAAGGRLALRAGPDRVIAALELPVEQ